MIDLSWAYELKYSKGNPEFAGHRLLHYRKNRHSVNILVREQPVRYPTRRNPHGNYRRVCAIDPDLQGVVSVGRHRSDQDGLPFASRKLGSWGAPRQLRGASNARRDTFIEISPTSTPPDERAIVEGCTRKRRLVTLSTSVQSDEEYVVGKQK
ncbi:hypothetical protein GEV33_005130 [Tenebrio molitor]|uniref:Uncharacterized protein n=1 Tax=Tenebrio molitor TaxID=7067 RepID=A0A8J6HPG2_TENMO|nr:hypothetical protein GEV33_005130 [Tenebrio molitor]